MFVRRSPQAVVRDHDQDGAKGQEEGRTPWRQVASSGSHVGRKKPLPHDASLMDKLEHDEAKCHKGADCSKKVRTSDQKVAKIVRDRFLGLCCSQIGVVQRDGMILRQRIVRDKQLVAEGHNIAMGKFYYQTLRKIYDNSLFFVQMTLRMRT